MSLFKSLSSILLSVSLLAFHACNENESGKSTLHPRLPDEHNLNHEEKATNPKDTTLPIILEKIAGRGLILPAEYITYDEDFRPTGILPIYKIQDVLFLEKSKDKHPQDPNDAYCHWSNYLKLVLKQDTLILWGDSILQVTAKYGDYPLNSGNINLSIASDFTVEAGDDEGLTGCDDYSHIILQSSGKAYHSILVHGSTQKTYKKFATLVDDDGMTEEFGQIEIEGDTLEIQVEVGYQDGGGSYEMRIFNDEGWKFIKCKEEFYESRRD